MDEFRAWVDEQGQAAVATALGCSSSLISHWLCGRKRMAESWAPIIERESGGRVICESLFPQVEWERTAGAVTGYRIRLSQAAA